MIQMTHHDDGKGKWQSHTISFRSVQRNTPEEYTQIGNASVSNVSILEINAYGETKEEALENLRPIMDWLFEEYKAIEYLYNLGHYEDNMVEVDAFGNMIEARDE